MGKLKIIPTKVMHDYLEEIQRDEILALVDKQNAGETLTGEEMLASRVYDAEYGTFYKDAVLSSLEDLEEGMVQLTDTVPGRFAEEMFEIAKRIEQLREACDFMDIQSFYNRTPKEGDIDYEERVNHYVRVRDLQYRADVMKNDVVKSDSVISLEKFKKERDEVKAKIMKSGQKQVKATTNEGA
jgi:hypothetical protein